MDCGRYWHSCCRVSLVYLVRWTWHRALARIDKAGLKRAAWAKATRSAGVVPPMVAFAKCIVGVGGWMLSSQSFEVAVQ